jgi:hypothetical protein
MIIINYTRLFRKFCYIIIFLASASVGFKLLLHFFPGANTFWLNKFFFAGGDENLPSLYSTLQLWLASLILFIITAIKISVKDKFRVYWVILSITFFFIGLDKWISFHKSLSVYLHDQFHFTGVFYLAWLIPAVNFVIAFGLFFLPFLLALPVKTRKRIFTAAFLFVTGAAVLKMAESVFIEKNQGETGIITLALIHLEEILEMFGVAYFIFALLEYIYEYMAADIKLLLVSK